MSPVQTFERYVLSRRVAVAILLALGVLTMSAVRGEAARAAALPTPYASFKNVWTWRTLGTDCANKVLTDDVDRWGSIGNTHCDRWAPGPGVFGATVSNVVTLRHYATGRCLDSNFLGQVYTNPCNSPNRYQNWVVLARDSVSVVLQDLQTGRVLDSNFRGDVYTLPENGGAYQKWIVSAAGL